MTTKSKALAVQNQGTTVALSVTQSDLINLVVSRVEVHLESKKTEAQKQIKTLSGQINALDKQIHQIDESFLHSKDAEMEKLAKAVGTAFGKYADVTFSPKNDHMTNFNSYNTKAKRYIYTSIDITHVDDDDDNNSSRRSQSRTSSNVQIAHEFKTPKEQLDFQKQIGDVNKQIASINEAILEIEYKQKKLPIFERHIKAKVTEKILSSPPDQQLDALAFIDSLNFDKLLNDATKAAKSIEAANNGSTKRR